MPKKYPLEFKKQAIRRYEKGESIPVLCQELHISQSTFYHWRNQYRSIQTSAHTYTPAEFDALIRRLQKAEHKLSIIQLSGYLSKVPLQDKLATLEHFHNEMSDLYSVHELCEALDVSRGTFYNHIFRRADRSKYESEKAQLILKVKQILDDSEQRYGADKIRAVLAESGLRISTKRISSIMQELGLHSIRTDAKKVYKNQMRKKQNLLRRKFTADHPNQVWVSDITYFKIKNAWVYLCAIIDLFSRKVVGYRVSRTASTRLVTTTFRRAYAERGYPQSLTFHSDRGGSIFPQHLVNFCSNMALSNPFPQAARLSIMRSQRHSLPHSKKRKPTGANILLNGTFERAWMNISVFTMRFAHIRR